MVSRRNFFTIMTLLLIMLFMFMFVSVIKQHLNEYDRNSFEMAEDVKQELLGKYAAFEESMLEMPLGRKTVLYLGDGESLEVVKTWCSYEKRGFRQVDSLKGLKLSGELPEVLVVDGESIDAPAEAEKLAQLAGQGVCVIFATMPEAKIIDESDELKALLGINVVYSQSMWLDGMHLFPGLLIGGETIYEAEDSGKNRQDKAFNVPWYMVGEGTKTYMIGFINDTIRESYFMPAILWRHSLGDGKVFCVNGDYLKNMYGMGLLTAFVAEKDSYDIYPVINAQNMVLANYGGFADENDDLMYQVYDQSQSGVYREVIWPAMISLTEKTGGKLSMMITAQMDYEDNHPSRKGQLVYYLKLLKEYSGEAGLSTYRREEMDLRKKMEKDLNYWKAETDKYRLLSLYAQDENEYEAVKDMLPDLQTVTFVKDGEVPIRYTEDGITFQTATSIGVEYSFLKDFAVKCYETALGYSNIILDLSKVAYPERDEYWEVISDNITRNLSTYWKDFKGFSQTTITDSDDRIRKFLALDYEDSRQEDGIMLHVDSFCEQAYFVLKLNREVITEITGAEAVELQNDFYLLTVTQPDVFIRVEEKQSMKIH